MVIWLHNIFHKDTHTVINGAFDGVCDFVGGVCEHIWSYDFVDVIRIET